MVPVLIESGTNAYYCLVKKTFMIFLYNYSRASEFYTVHVPNHCFVYRFDCLTSTVPYRTIFILKRLNRYPNRFLYSNFIINRWPYRVKVLTVFCHYSWSENRTVPIKLTVYRFVLEKRLPYRLTTENGSLLITQREPYRHYKPTVFSVNRY